MTLLAIDGGKNVGYALFTSKGEEIERGVLDLVDFFTAFDWDKEFQSLSFEWDHRLHEITQLVVEGFRHDPNVKQGGSLHWASQIEGAVKMLGALSETRVAVQYAGQALPVAKEITGYTGDRTRTGSKKHLPDQDSAWLHGRYWLHANEVI